MFAEHTIDLRLVSPAVAITGLEPGDDIRVQPQRNLLLHRPIEDPAPRIGPVENLRRVGGIDLVLRQCLERPYLLLNVRRQLSNVLVYKPPSCASLRGSG